MAGHLAVQLHGNVVLANRLQRLVESDLAAIDGEALGLKLLRDIARGDRAEEMLVLANLALEHELNLRELRGQLFRPCLLLDRLAHSRGLHLLDHSLVGGGRLDGELFGEQVVAPIAIGDLDHVAAMSELIYVFLQNDFHCSSPISCLAIASASLSYPVSPLVSGGKLEARSEGQQRDVARLFDGQAE